MAELTDAQIDRFEEKGRLEFGVGCPTKVTRWSPDVYSDIITMPEDCFQVLEILWKGWPLEDLKQHKAQNWRAYGSFGVPTHFEYVDIDYKAIRLFPTPTAPLPSGDEDTGVLSCCIISYQVYNGTANPLPAYFERRYLKLAVMEQAYAAEGKFQNLKSANYFKKRRRERMELYTRLVQKLHNQPRQLVINSGISAERGFYDRRRDYVLGP